MLAAYGLAPQFRELEAAEEAERDGVTISTLPLRPGQAVPELTLIAPPAAGSPQRATRAPVPVAPGRPGAVTVGVDDRAGRLSSGDLDLLRTEPGRLDLPVQVTHVEYLLFGTGADNLNDTVERYAQSERSDLVSEDRAKWAPGHLLVAVSTHPQRNGIYCGDDVCAALDLFEGRHLDGSLEAMKDPLRRGNMAAGLLQGATAAVDPTVLGRGKAWIAWLVGGIVAGIAALVGAIVLWFRRRKVATARRRFDRVSREYGRIATELDGLDIRANSLTSPLADDRLRGEWDEVRRRFLELDDVMDRLDHLGSASSSARFREAAEDIETAHTTVDQMVTAEKNIEELFAMEQGDGSARRRQLGALHEDMLAAALGTEDEALVAEVRALDARVDELTRDTAADDFMDRYTRIIVDYGVVIAAIRRAEMSDVATSEYSGDRHAPRIYDSDWHAGSGHSGYVSYSTANDWHSEDVSLARSSSSSGTSTGYSSSSFSGGGGSSRW